MERELIGNCLFTTANREHLAAVLRHACRLYKVRTPHLKIEKAPTGSLVGYCTSSEIVLCAAGDGLNLSTLLHELAHWIVHEYEGAVEDHGPEFVGIYAELMDRYRVLPIDAFEVLRKRWGLKVKYPGAEPS